MFHYIETFSVGVGFLSGLIGNGMFFEILEIIILRVKELLSGRFVSPVNKIRVDSPAVFVFDKQFRLCLVDEQSNGRRQFVGAVFVYRQFVLVGTFSDRGGDNLYIG